MTRQSARPGRASARYAIGVLGALALAAASQAPAQTWQQVVSPGASTTPDAERQIKALTLRHDRFVLDNGLRVLVHTDRKAPVVAVDLSYAVGTRDETPERAGFAHLFEHLMFSATPYAPKGWLDAMSVMGATAANGNTSYDATHFMETVPTGALERVLFLEADRMAHLGNRIDQAMLDQNRGVVQNEKRQTDNQPLGGVAERTMSRLFPAGHPFGHSVLGSMRTLDAASLADVREWHRRHYGPDNAVLVLSGDIDGVAARRLVARYFGSVPRGSSPTPRAEIPVATLAAPITDTITDRVSAVTVTRHWVVPGLSRPDGVAIDMAAKAMGSLSGAWLDERLVRRERLASSVMASGGAGDQLGTFIISYTVADGVDPARVAAAGLPPLVNLAILDAAGTAGLIGRGWYAPGLSLFVHSERPMP